jgi:uncharacterized protein YbjQ (UPF0145 family)
MFSDIAASFSDIFGGTSTSYQKQLGRIHESAVQDLQEQAVERGGTAVVGLAVDHDQISGGNRQLLMVTATATAVRATPPDSTPGSADDDHKPGSVVSAEQLDVDIRINQLQTEADEEGISFNDGVWRFLIQHQVTELGGYIRDLVNDALKTRSSAARQEEFATRAKEYFRALSPSDAKRHLYALLARGYPSAFSYAGDLIIEQRLLDWEWVDRLLSGDSFQWRKRVLYVLANARKRTYNRDDIDKINDVINRIESGFPKQGEVVEVDETGMFASGTKEMWTIDDGQPVPMEKTYDPASGKDIYGFKHGETRPEDAVDALKTVRRALADRHGEDNNTTD